MSIKLNLKIPSGKDSRQDNHKTEKPDSIKNQAFEKTPGNDLLSHTVTRIVPSALRGLSALFGMGRGISPAALSPEKLLKSRPVLAGLLHNRKMF